VWERHETNNVQINVHDKRNSRRIDRPTIPRPTEVELPMSVQNTLDGEEATEQKRSGGVRTGTAAILDKAPPDTSWERVAKWVLRARAEGVIPGGDQ